MSDFESSDSIELPITDAVSSTVKNAKQKLEDYLKVVKPQADTIYKEVDSKKNELVNKVNAVLTAAEVELLRREISILKEKLSKCEATLNAAQIKPTQSSKQEVSAKQTGGDKKKKRW